MKAMGTYGSCIMYRIYGRPAFADFVYLAPFVVNVSAPAIGCKNQSKSNQIRPNPTKSNHYFFEGRMAFSRWFFLNLCGRLRHAWRNLRFL